MFGLGLNFGSQDDRREEEFERDGVPYVRVINSRVELTMKKSDYDEIVNGIKAYVDEFITTTMCASPVNFEKLGNMSKEIVGGKMLKNIAPGETFKIGEYEFIVLEHSEGNTAVISKDLLFESEEFGENNNYADSNVDRICIDFGKKIEAFVGEGNLALHSVDLTSDDGLKDYGTVKRFMSLITCDMYRRYVEIFDKHMLDKWWWLATPWSTPRHEDSEWIKCVSPHGDISNYGYFSIGVRPFCILKSNIIVSK